MSWLFSQALVEEYSEDTCLDGAQYAQLNVMPTPHKFWRNDKTMEFYDLSRFGLTLNLLTESRGEELLTLYLLGSLANRTQWQESEKVCRMKDGCGMRSSELEKNVTLDLFGSKMFSESHQTEPLNKSFKTWPKWASLRNKDVSQQPTAGQSMYERGYGYLPTPTAHNAKEGAYPAEYTRNTKTLATYAGGKINPEWTEFLMGWPIGWTDLKPLAMDKFQEWMRLHSVSCKKD